MAWSIPASVIPEEVAGIRARLAPPPAIRPGREPESPGLWLAAWRRLIKKPAAVISLVYIVGLILVAVFAPYLAPFKFDLQNYDVVRLNPGSPGHLLGTDALGRDILSRMIYGTRVSMTVAGVVLAIEVVAGMTLGSLAAYYGGWADMLIMRLTDIMFAFPDLLLAILIMGIRGPGLGNLFFAISVVSWPGLARLVRGQVLALKESEFVLAARSLGTGDSRIILRHLVPNVLSPVLVSATQGLAGVILTEASLSFLGIGIRPPQPSWGSMINDMISFVYSQPVLLIGPSVILACTVLAFNFLGDGLRDALDPRLKH
ncbi:MAG TPA: ABC transporter permease [Symbiobacteriaceae bacterium]|jgi:ABC-type dipeptide/oligopeptide/nickel transport system permease subunit